MFILWVVSLNILPMNNSHTLSYKIMKTLIFHMLKCLETNTHSKYIVKADQNQEDKTWFCVCGGKSLSFVAHPLISWECKSWNDSLNEQMPEYPLCAGHDGCTVCALRKLVIWGWRQTIKQDMIIYCGKNMMCRSWLLVAHKSELVNF